MLDDLERRFVAREAALRAFVPEADRFARLRRDLDLLAARFPDSKTRPVLFGLPVAVKDIFHVTGFATRAGSRLPPDVLGGPEATAVARLRAAGALILGKAATTEFAYFGPGPTVNPHDAERTPGGSSSGSAAAVGAGLCPLALGTQTIGSVGRPAAYCGAVGFKPTYDRIPRDGIIPLATSLDHVGTFTPDVGSAVHAASVLLDDWRPNAPVTPPTLGVPSGRYLDHAEAAARDHFATCRAQLAAAGYAIVEVEAWDDFEAVRRRHDRLVAAEAARTHQAWFRSFGDRYHPKTAALVTRGLAIDDDALAVLRAEQLAFRDRLRAVMRAAGIDGWLTPGAPGPAPRGLDSTGNPVLSLPWSQAGLPTLTVPAGHDASGMPLGIQLVGTWRGDEALLAWGATVAEMWT